MKIHGSSIIDWFTRNPVAANLLMLVILVSGIVSAVHIRKEFFPEFATGTIHISVAFPGAAPEDVEQGVVVKVEEALQGVDGIKKITASAHEGLAALQVRVLNGYTVDTIMDRIKSRVDGITTFPDEAEKPVITEETTRDGVLWLILSGPLSEKALKSLAQQVKDELTRDPHISQVEIHGTREREIRIELSEAAMSKYGLSFDAVADAVRKNSLDLPAGTLETQSGDLLLRTNAQAYTAKQFEDIALVTRRQGGRVSLGQVARVIDGFEEADWFLRFQGQSAVGLQVFRVGSQSTLDVAAAAKSYAMRKAAALPPGVELTAIADTSIMLRDRLDLMLKNLGWGGLLVFISLVLFLRFRVAFWVMAGLPVCFLGTIWLMPTPPIDISINMITLFGFILVLGIVVDDAIVIGENIHSTVARQGAGIRSVVFGARQVATAATFGVLTTIAAFVPMLMIPGINGKIWRGIALVVILCLAFSLIESKLILPAHLVHLRTDDTGRGVKNPLVRLQRWISRWMAVLVRRVYQPLLDVSLRHWMTTLSVFVAVVIITVGMVNSGRVRFVFFPDIESDTIEANLELTAGTPLAAARAAAQQIESAAQTVNTLYKQETGMSEDVIRSVIALTTASNRVWFYAELIPSEKRPVGSNAIINRWRQATPDIPGMVSLKFSGSAAESESPISFELKGTDFTALQNAARELKRRLAAYEGVFDTQDSLEKGKNELKLRLKAGAEHLGLSVIDLARQVRQGFYGGDVQTLQRSRDEVKVKVRYPRSERKGMTAFDTMQVRTDQGLELPFRSVAETRLKPGFASIERADRQRVIRVFANVDKHHSEPQRIINDMEARVIPKLLAKYPGLQYDLAGEAKESKASLDELKRGAVLALLLIYAMMAIPLKSYIQPLIIMAAIPFGFVGAIWGHCLVGLPVSILSVCGIIALSGVVVNDSLVMVDVINQKRAAGQPMAQAVRDSGVARFRAIVLTSLTTFLGLLPMLLEKSLQAQFLIPMSVSLAFGILFATVITLILVPSLYVAGATWLQRLRPMFHKEIQPALASGQGRD
jgi:multidrug efflux pump subunit AcrB